MGFGFSGWFSTRSARMIRRLWKVGMGVQVWSVTMSRLGASRVTYVASGPTRNFSVTR